LDAIQYAHKRASYMFGHWPACRVRLYTPVKGYLHTSRHVVKRYLHRKREC
jgi:hypothetical protein